MKNINKIRKGNHGCFDNISQILIVGCHHVGGHNADANVESQAKKNWCGRQKNYYKRKYKNVIQMSQVKSGTHLS